MKKIAHISDLHFGTVNEVIANGLIIRLKEINPDLVVISGDLTQRARKNQYHQAQVFLDRIKFRKVVIPGNHDIPLFDIIRRFFFPLTRYKKYISADLSPLYMDEEMIVLGINTARSFTWKNGRISTEQISKMKETLCTLGNERIKIVVTHHPFLPPPGDNGISLVGRSIKALKVIDACSVDLLLAGHLHQGYSGDIRTHYPSRKRSVISIQAGTATSMRTRKENNAFNMIFVNSGTIDIQINIWEKGKFNPMDSISYKRENNNWIG